MYTIQKKISFLIIGVLILSIFSGHGFVKAESLADKIKQSNAQLASLEAQIKAIQSQKAQTQNQRDQKQAQILDLQTKVSNLNNQIKDFNSQIAGVKDEISTTTNSTVATENRVKEFQAKVEYQKAVIADVLVEIYQRSLTKNELYTVAQAKSVAQVFDEVEYSNRLQINLQTTIIDLNKTKAELQKEIEALNAKKSELDALQTNLNDKKSSLENSKNQVNNLVNKTQTDVAQINQNLTQLNNTQQDLDQKRIESRKQIEVLESQLRSQYGGGAICAGQYNWPVKGGRITQGYGKTDFGSESGFYKGGFHNGIDIAAPIGTPIYAASNGVVASVGFNNLSYGKWVVIQHQDGFYSLYGHMSVQAVQQGQKVSAGDQIGAIGTTGLSTGAHLHFTLYQPGSLRVGSSPYGATISPLTCKY